MVIPALNRYVWNWASTDNLTWRGISHEQTGKPWCVYRAEQAQEGGFQTGTEFVVACFPTRKLAQQVARLLGQAFFEGRLQERAETSALQDDVGSDVSRPP